MQMYLTNILLLALGSFLIFASTEAQLASSIATPTDQDVARATSVQDFKHRQMEFLNRIRDSDPQQQIIVRAMLNERKELGLIVNRNVEMQKVPALMRALLTQMARRFSNQDFTILAYAPTKPPLKLGTAHLDARTGDMAYLPEHK